MRRLSVLPNWMDVVGNAMEMLCTTLREMQAILISWQMAKKAFAESVFEHVKRSPNYAWLPEDGKYFYYHYQLLLLIRDSPLGG